MFNDHFSNRKIISKLCRKTLSGIDGMPGTLFVAVKNDILPILSQLINQSFYTGVPPVTTSIDVGKSIYWKKLENLMICVYRV